MNRRERRRDCPECYKKWVRNGYARAMKGWTEDDIKRLLGK